MRIRPLLATALLVLFSNTASADELTETFGGNDLDAETFVSTVPAGFDMTVAGGKAVLTKLEGTGNGFVNVTTAFTIKGDFEITVVAERTAATSGSAMGLVTSHISQVGFSDVYFSGTGNVVSNIFVDPVHAQAVIAAPASALTFRIRRTGDHLIHEYDSGSGFTIINEAMNPVLGGPIQAGIFLGEETGQAPLARATFDELAIEGDVFTDPCGNGVLEQGELCDDDSPAWATGEFCDAACEILPCGDTDDSGSITVVDALHTLRTSVGTRTCDACICNVDSSAGNSPTTVTDALLILRMSVGQPVELVCPSCI